MDDCNQQHESFQAFPNSQQKKCRPYGDGVVNDCWEEMEKRSGGIHLTLAKDTNPWRSLYLVLQKSPMWPGERKQPESFAGEMFHITALLHFANAVHSLWELWHISSLKHCYSRVQEKALISCITSLYSYLDIHCHLLICLNEDDLSTTAAKLVRTWNGQCPEKKEDERKTWKMQDFFKGKVSKEGWAEGGPAQLREGFAHLKARGLRNPLRNRVVHTCYQYVVPKRKPGGSYLLRPDLPLDELVLARETAVDAVHSCKTSDGKRTGWDFVPPESFYRPNGEWLDVRDLLRDLLKESLDFIRASSEWLDEKWS